MTILDAMNARHAVRQYTEQPLSAITVTQLQHDIDLCNHQHGLRIQLVTGEPDAFSGMMAHYGKFRGVRNYIALVGKKQPDLDERAGYCGERLVLKAQALGLNSCWVAMTFSKKKTKIEIGPGERLVCVIALGYGVSQGVPHQSKPMESLYDAEEPIPVWFLKGMQAALLAPTALNQQKFRFTLNGNTVKAISTGGFCSKIDLGIVKYHFEIGAGTEHFNWCP